MKRTFLFMIILFMAVFMLAGCDSTSGGNGKEFDSTSGGNGKEFRYEIKNISGEQWALIGDFDSDFVYTGDNYGLDTEFAIRAGKSESESFDAHGVQRLIESGRLEETSETTYKITMKFIAGRIPNDPGEDTITTGLIMQNITIIGGYNKTAVIEWDGSNFKQAK